MPAAKPAGSFTKVLYQVRGGDTVADEERKRLKRFERDANSPGITLTDRDLVILQALYFHRVLRQDHLQQLFFRSKERTQKRLRRLYNHAYIDRIFVTRTRGGKSPNHYVLDRKGADVLKAEFPELEITWYHSYKELSDMYLRHALPLNDVMVFVHAASQQHNFEIRQWHTQAQLKAVQERVVAATPKGKRSKVPLQPDSYFEIAANGRLYPCFVEYDGTTQSGTVIKQKVLAYKAYYESGRYTQVYGRKSFRVLFVTDGGRRMANLKTWTEQLRLPGLERFWFAVHPQLSPRTILTEPVWFQAGREQARSLLPVDQQN
jgi:hypothetical protein